MGILRDEWEKHNGAMERLSGTTEGLESTFTDLVAQVAGATAAFVGADTAYKKFLETSNQVLTGTLDMLNGVRDLDAEIVDAAGSRLRHRLTRTSAGRGRSTTSRD